MFYCFVKEIAWIEMNITHVYIKYSFSLFVSQMFDSQMEKIYKLFFHLSVMGTGFNHKT